MSDAEPHFGPDDFKGKVLHKEWEFDGTDFLLIAMLQDPVLAPEFAWKNASNVAMGGCYRVRDYQTRFNRIKGKYQAFACARSVGKSERQQILAFTHFFRRLGQNLLITAPELLHLMPLADKIEDRITNCRLTSECLKRERAGQTGFHHNPFGVDFSDGTKIVGRIPNRDGRGVKGQHQPDLMVEEGQDYPDAGWTEVHETVEKEWPDFTYHIYGVHRGAQGGGFMKRVTGGTFTNNCITAIQRPGWGAEEKAVAIDTYGGTNSPDYRRNILGEPGSASSPMFVTSRLMACIDQDRESRYNQIEYARQLIRWEEFEQQYRQADGSAPKMDAVRNALDLPGKRYRLTLAGADLGLTSSPTVISIFGERDEKGTSRLCLIRRITLERFPTPYIRRVLREIYEWDRNILGIGLDTTGLGFPIFQEIQHDEASPDPGMLEAIRGWKFNEKIPVGIDPSLVVDGKDPHGRRVKEDEGVIMMSVIEATTRYLREWVDTGYVMLPFDTEISNDLLAENMQRITSVAGLTGSKKPNAFHILDSFRMAALIQKVKTEVVNVYQPGPVLDSAVDY